jgi:hypothetical protein
MANCLVLIGVTGSGKTTLGKALRRDAGYDADDLHPETNNRKMAPGEPLTDAERCHGSQPLPVRIGSRSLCAHARSGSGDPEDRTELMCRTTSS